MEDTCTCKGNTILRFSKKEKRYRCGGCGKLAINITDPIFEEVKGDNMSRIAEPSAVSLKVQLHVTCEGCGKPVQLNSCGFPNEITVKPCQTCLTKAYNSGNNDCVDSIEKG